MKNLIHPSWHFLLDIPEWKENFKLLKLYRDQVHPSPQVVLNPFRHPVEDIKAVIIQEFPFNRKVSNGYAYGTYSEVQVSQCLYAELYTDYQESLPFSPKALETKFSHFWGPKLAAQGVLLLVKNIARIDDENITISWEATFKEIMEKVLLPKEVLVWMLWGKSLWKLSESIPDHHFVVKTAKPTSYNAKHSFLGSRPFTRANKYFEENKVSPIKWVILNQ